MIEIRGDNKLTGQELFLAKSKIKGLIYARVSSDDQVDNYSLESQVDLCKDYAIKHLGYEEDELMAFIEEGEMGDNPDRPALNYMLKLLTKDGIGEVVIVYDSDRLARDNFLQRWILNQILEAEATLKLVNDSSFNPFDENEMLKFNIKGVLAEYMKKKIRSESKRGRMTKVKKHQQLMGLGRIYGYTFNKEKDMLEINPFERDVILRIVDMLLNQDMSCSQIAQQLSKEGIPAPKGNVWYQATISRMLKNETYTGKFYYGKTEVIQIGGKRKQVPQPREKWIEIPVPAIIDEATFLRIQEKLNKLKRTHSGRPSDAFLKGIGRCGKCGSAVVIGRVTKLKSKKLNYYVCVRKNKSGYVVGTGEKYTKCTSRTWRQDIIDDLVWKHLVEKLKNPDLIIKSILKQQGDIQKAGNLFKKRKDLEKKIEEQNIIKERYIDLYAMGTIKTKEDLERKLEPIEENIRNLKIDIDIIDEQLKYITANYDELELLKERVQKFKEIIDLDNLTDEQKRDFIQKFVKKVVLHDDEIEIHTTWNSREPFLQEEQTNGEMILF